MQKINNIQEIKNWVKLEKSRAKTTALVATMGGLHLGHLALIDLAKTHADKVIVSIFVNPAQFSEDEDFDTYPRSIAPDLALLKSKNVDAVFTPETTEIYPENSTFQRPDFAEKQYLFDILCGQTRPHFFYGVLQVVERLFEIMRPDVAVFGQKDYQQFKIIQNFTQGVEIIKTPTIRETDGLAMSTRNVYLSASQRKIAPQLQQTLRQLSAAEISKNQARQILEKSFKLDYLEVLDADTLEKIDDNTQQIAILCAVFLGTIRLIDNIIYTSGGKPS